jgi:hypothetical protein
MASGIGAWSTTASNNDDADTDINWAEGQAPSTVNDSARAMMAAVAVFLRDNGFIELKEHSHTYASATSTTVAGTNVTAYYTAGRRVRAVGSSTGTIYGTVVSSSFSTNTTIVYKWDASGALSNEALAISVNLLSPKAMGGLLSGALNTAKAVAVASATSCDIFASNGNVVHITGTTQIDDFGTAPQAGVFRIVIFDDALTLTHNASAIVLPGAASITTAANDIAIVFADTTTKHLVFYQKASGQPVIPSGRVLLSETSVSGASSLSITGIGATYDRYEIEFDCNTTVDGANIHMLLSDDGGSSYFSTSYQWAWSYIDTPAGSVGAVGTTLDSKIILTPGVGNGAGENAAYSIKLARPAQTARLKAMYWDGAQIVAAGSLYRVNGGGFHNGGGSAISAVRMLPSSGSFNATAKLYGLR